MNRLYNISLYSELESSEFNSSFDFTILFWSNYIREMFPWREQWWIDNFFLNSSSHKDLKKKFDNWEGLLQ